MLQVTHDLEDAASAGGSVARMAGAGAMAVLERRKT
jgi:hypothetical protein